MAKAAKAGTASDLKLRLRVKSGDDVVIGPGKAELLERIGATGSIAAAGRAMGMSYKRAWALVATMNRCFAEPLVATARGGRKHGGATLTPAGEAVLAAFRRLVETVEADAEYRAIAQLLSPNRRS